MSANQSPETRDGRYIVFKRNKKEVKKALLQLVIFICVATLIVYFTQHKKRTGINNILDAAYFTVSAMTTTGLGDVTLQQSTSGKVISIVIMILGLGLVVQLIEKIAQPSKLVYTIKDTERFMLESSPFWDSSMVEGEARPPYLHDYMIYS